MSFHQRFPWNFLISIGRSVNFLLRIFKTLLFSVSQKKPLEEKNIKWWKTQPVYLSTGQMLGHIDLIASKTKEGIQNIACRGWLFHLEKGIQSLRFPAFQSDNYVVVFGLRRDDVENAFSGRRYSGTGGFVASFSVPDSEAALFSKPLRFLATLEDSEEIEGVFPGILCSDWPELTETDVEQAITVASEATDTPAGRSPVEAHAQSHCKKIHPESGSFAATIVRFLYGIDIASLRNAYSYLPKLSKSLHSIGLESPSNTKLEDMAPHVLLLTLYQEDEEFFIHGIYNWKEVRRRLSRFILKGEVGSGSSITQQVAKLIYAGSEWSLKRKLKEALVAHALEREYSKEEIFYFYLNSLRLARWEVFGVGMAADYYFGRKASELTLTESLMISCLIRSPMLRQKALLTAGEEEQFPFKTAFEKLFELFRCYYHWLGPGFLEKLDNVRPAEAILLAKSSLFKDAPLNPSVHLALELEVVDRVFALKNLAKKLQEKFNC